ncbi:MAG: preprotein translocase subunit YajC [Bacteroidota bacterium]
MYLLGIPVQQIFLISSIALVFYFFMIRPQQRRQKEYQEFLEQIKKGESVVTIGGIHGTIYEVTADLVTLEIDKKGSKLTIAKGAISIESTKRYKRRHNNN